MNVGQTEIPGWWEVGRVYFLTVCYVGICGAMGYSLWGTPYDGLYGEAPPGRRAFLRPQVYERVTFH